MSREKRGNEKGQVTIFIIIAILIVVVLLFIFYPRIKVYVTPATPSGYIEDCVKEELGVIETLEKQGGSLNPRNFVLYNNEKIEYLCYTNEYYKTCTMQQPLLESHVESEIYEHLKPVVDKCVAGLVTDLRSKGYSVTQGETSFSVEIVPKNIKIIIQAGITATKDSSQSFDKFAVSQKSSLFELLSIASSINNWEARYGDSVPEMFMMHYPNLKVEKLKQGDGSKIYILTDRESEEYFQFATRSLSWPGGYGVPGQKVR